MYEFVSMIGEHVARLGTIPKSVGDQKEEGANVPVYKLQ